MKHDLWSCLAPRNCEETVVVRVLQKFWMCHVQPSCRILGGKNRFTVKLEILHEGRCLQQCGDEVLVLWVGKVPWETASRVAELGGVTREPLLEPPCARV